MISATTRLAAVIGHPVHHSRSPQLHNAAFAKVGVDAVFVATDVTPERLGDAVRGFRAMDFIGVSVTVPHKQTVLAHCDAIGPFAARIGAVNCLVLRDGQVVGHNTDAQGYVNALIEQYGALRAGSQALLLGGGGAARAIAAGLENAGVTVRVVARSPSKVDFAAVSPWTEHDLEKECSCADLIVDCTPLGLSQDTDDSWPSPIPVQSIANTAIVTTLVYHRQTALLARASARGLRTLDGSGMLVHQAALAFELWTGRPAPISVMHSAMADKVR